ncbi:hypothetical protein [Lysinibacillus xylanilyticus]|uniref:hypothetical protein n=1 Tax=Lysinibacillus xylanilyticus TaxID=582475 RepID=UPI0038165F0E
MQSTIDQLYFWINKVPEEFRQMSEIEISQRPAPQKWSKKEILGHLVTPPLIIWKGSLKYNTKRNP